jgi:hypothetical protein
MTSWIGPASRRKVWRRKISDAPTGESLAAWIFSKGNIRGSWREERVARRPLAVAFEDSCRCKDVGFIEGPKIRLLRLNIKPIDVVRAI